MKKTTPKYEAVTKSLRELAATLKPGDSFPAHTEVARRFGVSHGTALRALDILRHDGHIARRNGVGTFVAHPNGAPPLPAPPTRLLPAMMTDRRTVGAVMLPDSSYFAHCVNRLYHRAEANGLSLVCRVMEPTEDPADFPVPSRDEDRPLGFVLFDWKRIAPLARRLLSEGNRVVVIGAPPQNVTPDVPNVYGDDEQGGYLLARYLFDLGHSRIATTSFHEWTLRWQGYQRAVREADRARAGIVGSRIKYDEFQGWFRDPARAAHFLRAPDAPTAILCWNDDEAARMVSALTRAGLRVPEDISVVGYDNLPSALSVYPHLTTVDQGIDSQLRMALDLLLRPDPPPVSHSVMVVPSLIVRESTGVPPPS